MIVFTCSCGKKYQLPDRNAGREVRCNQCGKTLTVPSSVGGASAPFDELAPDSNTAAAKARPLIILPLLLTAVIAFILGGGLGFFIGLNNGNVGNLKSGMLERPVEAVPKPPMTETSTQDETLERPALEEEVKKEEPDKEEPKKDKKAAVLDEIGKSLSEGKE